MVDVAIIITQETYANFYNYLPIYSDCSGVNSFCFCNIRYWEKLLSICLQSLEMKFIRFWTEFVITIGKN